jgi:hypothetical protein
MIRHSLERAYAFPRVRITVASLLLSSATTPPASQDRARIVFDCRTVNDPAMMSSTLFYTPMLRTLIQIAALYLTLGSAVFLLKGNLALSPQSITELSSTKIGYNMEIATNLAKQNADTWIGLVLLLIAFFLQMWNLGWPIPWCDFAVSRAGMLYAAVFVILLPILGQIGSRILQRRTMAQVKDRLTAISRSRLEITDESRDCS